MVFSLPFSVVYGFRFLQFTVSRFAFCVLRLPAGRQVLCFVFGGY